MWSSSSRLGPSRLKWEASVWHDKPRGASRVPRRLPWPPINLRTKTVPAAKPYQRAAKVPPQNTAPAIVSSIISVCAVQHELSGTRVWIWRTEPNKTELINISSVPSLVWCAPLSITVSWLKGTAVTDARRLNLPWQGFLRLIGCGGVGDGIKNDGPLSFCHKRLDIGSQFQSTAFMFGCRLSLLSLSSDKWSKKEEFLVFFFQLFCLKAQQCLNDIITAYSEHVVRTQSASSISFDNVIRVKSQYTEYRSSRMSGLFCDVNSDVVEILGNSSFFVFWIPHPHGSHVVSALATLQRQTLLSCMISMCWVVYGYSHSPKCTNW